MKDQTQIMRAGLDAMRAGLEARAKLDKHWKDIAEAQKKQKNEWGARLLKVASSYLHEPDECGISATVEGNHLDNAFGDRGECGEFVVHITKEDVSGSSHPKETVTETFNLANLIEFAWEEARRRNPD